MGADTTTPNPTPDAEREALKPYADALFGLAATDMSGAVKIAQAALVQYSDGWRLVARFDGLDDRVRMTGYCIDPMTVLENCGVVNARAERAEAERDTLRAENARLREEQDAALAREARLREACQRGQRTVENLAKLLSGELGRNWGEHFSADEEDYSNTSDALAAALATPSEPPEAGPENAEWLAQWRDLDRKAAITQARLDASGPQPAAEGGQ